MSDAKKIDTHTYIYLPRPKSSNMAKTIGGNLEIFTKKHKDLATLDGKNPQKWRSLYI